MRRRPGGREACMETKLLGTTKPDIEEAARIIKEGGLVAFPTETVYGLGADAMNSEAVSKVYKAKGRPSDNPMIVHIAGPEQILQLTFEVTGDMKNSWRFLARTIDHGGAGKARSTKGYNGRP